MISAEIWLSFASLLIFNAGSPGVHSQEMLGTEVPLGWVTIF